jgi:hypothetical protein
LSRKTKVIPLFHTTMCHACWGVVPCVSYILDSKRWWVSCCCQLLCPIWWAVPTHTTQKVQDLWSLSKIFLAFSHVQNKCIGLMMAWKLAKTSHFKIAECVMHETVYCTNISTDQSTMGMYHLKATWSSLGLCLFHWALTSCILHAVKRIFCD